MSCTRCGLRVLTASGVVSRNYSGATKPWIACVVSRCRRRVLRSTTWVSVPGLSSPPDFAYRCCLARRRNRLDEAFTSENWIVSLTLCFWAQSFCVLTASSLPPRVRVRTRASAFPSSPSAPAPALSCASARTMCALNCAHAGPDLSGQEGRPAGARPQERECVRAGQEEKEVEAAGEAKGDRVECPNRVALCVCCFYNLSHSPTPTITARPSRPNSPLPTSEQLAVRDSWR